MVKRTLVALDAFDDIARLTISIPRLLLSSKIQLESIGIVILLALLSLLARGRRNGLFVVADVDDGTRGGSDRRSRLLVGRRLSFTLLLTLSRS